MTRTLTLLALSTAALAMPAVAKSSKSEPVQLDPTKAYVLVEVDTAKHLPAGQIVLARYDLRRGDIRGRGRAADAGKPPAGEGTDRPMLKDGGRALYLLEVEPDFWVVEGANGTAFSLGSAGIRLAPGTVTDLGVAMIGTDAGPGEAPDKLTAGKLAKVALLGAFGGGALRPKPVPATVDFRPRTDADLAVPPSLRLRATAPAWSPPVKFGNYLGGLVNRMGGRKTRPGEATAAVTVGATGGGR